MTDGKKNSENDTSCKWQKWRRAPDEKVIKKICGIASYDFIKYLPILSCSAMLLWYGYSILYHIGIVDDLSVYDYIELSGLIYPMSINFFILAIRHYLGGYCNLHLTCVIIGIINAVAYKVDEWFNVPFLEGVLFAIIMCVTILITLTLIACNFLNCKHLIK